jgi:hypothetical protein
MARQFNGSSQSGTATSVPMPSTNVATFACWFNPAAAQGSLTGLLVSRNAAYSGLVFSSASGNPLTCVWNNGGYTQPTGLTPVNNTWNLGEGVINPPNFLTYLGQAGGTLSSYQISVGNFSLAPTSWDVADDPGNGRWFDGAVAEAALWSNWLTLPELNALLAGVNPQRIRPQSLVGYWPLWGLLSPEPDLSGNGNSMTLTGSPPAANHAPVTLFTKKARSQVEPAATASPLLIHRPVISLPPLSPALFE